MAGGGVFLYLQTKDSVEPSCFDNIQNQGEANAIKNLEREIAELEKIVGS